jgi:anti-anti-sigma factor
MAVLRTSIEQDDTQLRISHNPLNGWLAISGEIDAWNVSVVRDALTAAHGEAGDLHLDVSRLLFCDVTGIRAIVASAASLEDGRRLFLHGLDPRLQKVFRVVGWAGMPSLVIDTNGMDLR